MKCAIHQPQFLPWLGYFHKIGAVDVFVFLDNVQFKKNEFQNRNRIPGKNGAEWLTVPVSFKFGDTLRATRIADTLPWRRKIRGRLEQVYGKAPYFKNFAAPFFQLLDRNWATIADLNEATARWLMACFEIRTEVRVASQLPDFEPHPTRRLIGICRRLGADTYLSGAGGREYLDEPLFEEAGIRLEYQQFEHPVYAQGAEPAPFVSHLSAIDGLFHCGGGETGRKKLNL